MTTGFNFIDALSFGIYLIILLIVGLLVSTKRNNMEDYFLAGRSMNWFIIGIAMVITTVSGEHLIGYAKDAYSKGFATANYMWIAALILLVMAWVFVPFYIKNKIFTTPEFIEKRFGSSARWYFSILSVISYIITKASIILLAGALLLEHFFHWDKYTSSLLLVLITGFFAVAGGFRGIMRTSIVHFSAFFIAGIVMVVAGMIETDFFSNLHRLPADHFDASPPISSTTKDPWTGLFFGAPILAIWYWCSDQFMAQRVMSAKNLHQARGGSIFAGYLMIICSFLLLLPGIIARLYYVDPEIAQGINALNIPAEMLLVPEEKEFLYTTMIETNNIIPSGLKGIMIAGFLSALMSSLAATFNSASTLFTLDIYKKLYPNADDFKIVNVGKIATLVIVILSIIWIPFISYFSNDITTNLQKIQSYIAPPFTAVFLMGIIWHRTTAKAAILTMIIGSLVGFLRLALELLKKTLFGENAEGWIIDFVEMNALHFAIVLFLFYVLLIVIISLLTKKPDAAHQNGLTFKFRKNISYDTGLTEEQDKKWHKKNTIASFGIVVLLIILWISFS